MKFRLVVIMQHRGDPMLFYRKEVKMNDTKEKVALMMNAIKTTELLKGDNRVIRNAVKRGVSVEEAIKNVLQKKIFNNFEETMKQQNERGKND